MLTWDVKVMGYDLARRMAASLPAPPASDAPPRADLRSKGCVQADIESAWFSYWAGRLKVAPIYHRKLWEFCYILQSLSEAGALNPGAKGIGFGCGEEPLPSLFAQMGVSVLATDAPPEIVHGSGWVATGQYAKSLDALYKPDLCDRPTFDRLVGHRHVDMNRIPADLAEGFDFAWSSCALEHLGSIANGLIFIEKSLDCLKPGGVAVHTTEWNYASEDATLDGWDTVLFLRRHFAELADHLRARGYDVAPLDFDIGSGVLDRFVDVPPYSWDLADPFRKQLGVDEAHLRLTVHGYASTSFGMIIHKPKAG